MNRQAQAVIMLLVGGAVLRTSLTDDYLRYVKEGLRPFLIAAAALLIVAALMTLWYELRGTRTVDPGCEGAAVGHDDGHAHERKVAWLLVLPVFGLLLVAPPALGSYAANRSGTALQEVSDFPPLPAGDPVKVGLLDYASRAVFDEGKSLADRRVQLTGFVMAGQGGEWYLARMTLSCCAADARPIKVGLTGNLPGAVRQDMWLELTGTFVDKKVKDQVNGETIPFVEVVEAREIPAPAKQYEQ